MAIELISGPEEITHSKSPAIKKISKFYRKHKLPPDTVFYGNLNKVVDRVCVKLKSAGLW